MATRIAGIIVAILIFCAASFCIAPILREQARAEGYGMGAGGTPHKPTDQMSIETVNDIVSKSHEVAGMPRALFEQLNPIPANVLIESITINIHHDNDIVW